MKISVTIDQKGLALLNKGIQSQLPFATASALTKVAKLAQDEVKRELPRRFMIRNRFTENSIRTQRAEKRDWPNCKAVVGSISGYLPLHEDGGVKAPIGKAFSIPKGIRRSEQTLVSRSRWPGRILPAGTRIPGGGRTKGAVNGKRQAPKPFLLKEKGGVGVYIRTSRKGRALKRLYRLTRSSVHVRGNHWLVGPTERVINASLEKEFMSALSKALASSR